MNILNDQITIGYDSTFELNEFNNPRIRSEIETVKNIILTILFMKPGQYPSLPQIGIDIESMLYSFYDEINTEDLKQKIIVQCEALGVFFNKGNIGILKTKYKGQPALLIHIEGEEIYPSGYKKDNNRDTKKYLIGLTFDEVSKFIYNINEE